jgi:SiaC family regulatory phosphoprotein
MEKLILQPGPKTPHIVLDDSGYIELKGKSIPENSVEFYKPVFDWLDLYASNPQASTKVLVELEYFNTSSSKCILDIFRKLEALHESGRSIVSIAWLYDEDDEDMMETGEDYQTIVKVPFTISKTT